MATQIVKIRIIGGRCKVQPGNVRLAPGDRIRWWNRTTQRVVVLFPHDGVLGESPKRAFVKAIKKGKKFSVKGPSSSTPKDSYRYAVYCEQKDHFGIGNSDPEIIVT